MIIAGGEASPAAIRVALSRGYVSQLSHHAEAFPGLPLRIEGQLTGHDEDMNGKPHHRVTRFVLNTQSITPWFWPDK
jgi:hypothetical protein